MANAGCINAYNCDGCLIQTLGTLDSANIGVGVQVCVPDPLDDKRLDYIKYTDKCGNTCCLTGENELLIYATQGVIKNLTLTNGTNEVVNVKRTDLFGNNRKKTVVRYKTGGYPTSITDGTLAVEETIQNQYSSSGYNVSGLTDGTTYYFTSFAIDTDNNIIDYKSAVVNVKFIKAGIYHNSSLGIISLSVDGTNWFTIADRNLGATTNDVSSPNSYGDYYSRGAKQNRNGQSASGYTMQEDWSLGNQSVAPNGYHIPTQAERTNIIDIIKNLTNLTSLNYTHGYSYLLLPRSGQMLDSGTIIEYQEGTGGGYYWTATRTTGTNAYILRDTSSQFAVNGTAVGFPRGFPLRLFKDTAIQPQEGVEREILFQPFE